MVRKRLSHSPTSSAIRALGFLFVAKTRSAASVHFVTWKGGLEAGGLGGYLFDTKSLQDPVESVYSFSEASRMTSMESCLSGGRAERRHCI